MSLYILIVPYIVFLSNPSVTDVKGEEKHSYETVRIIFVLKLFVDARVS